MKYEHPNLAVSSPAPGHHVISGLPICRVQTDDGMVVAPDHCYISPNVPTEFLEAVIADRKGESAKGSGESSEGNALRDSIVGALKDGAVRIGDLAEVLGVTVEDIKALDGQGFEVARAGWCKLLIEEGAE